MKNQTFKVLLLSFFASIFTLANAQQLAFPGAEGFGKFATGGRGGKVYEVTNLNDAGPGSFREAFLSHPGFPLTIVFRVSGIIELQSQIKVNRSNITIAGQTAPGDGICLKGNSFIFNGARQASLGGNHGNTIIRYIRSRPGSTLSTGVYGFDMENCHDVIIDHCSFSWANEECAALYDTKNTTVQWCISSEGLYDAGHSKGVRSYSGVWGGQYATYHHNLIAHCVSRTTRFNGARAHDTTALVDYRNNVIYNWGSSSACYGGEMEIAGGTSQVNMVNNYYKKGPASASTVKFVQASYTVASAIGIGQWYLNGNVMSTNAAMSTTNSLGLDLSKIPAASQASAVSTTPFAIAQPINVFTAQQAYDSVLAYAGARLPIRDAVDTRIVNEATTGTASGTGTYTSGASGIINSPTAVGGWPTYNTYNVPTDTDHDGMPDAWEIANSLNIADSADGNIVGADGYTMLENYLNGITQNSALPLSLVSFDANVNKEGFASLKWSTSNEVNASHFLIEKSETGSVFYEAGTLAAKGLSANAYTFNDTKSIQTKSVFYRLKMIDKDGKFSYSRIIALSTKVANELEVYPNPVASSFTLAHNKSNSGASIKIYTQDGKYISSVSVTPNVKFSTVHVANLNRGVYIVSFTNDGHTYNTTFVKQ